MKKNTLVYIFSILLAISIVIIVKEENTTEKTQTKYANFLKNHPYNESLKLSKKERKSKGMPPNKYFEQEYLLEMNPNTGRTHPENVLKVQKELKQNRKQQRVPGDAADNVWVERGPNNVGGRTRAVLFDPNDETQKRVFAGGVSGGLWVNNDITDADVSWTRVGIDENLSVSCITVDPNDSQIWYVGTGESYTQSQALGNGVWKSTDGGASWENIYNKDNEDLDNRLFYVNDIIAWNNPSTNATELFIGVGAQYYTEGSAWTGARSTGIYKSTNGGSNWNKIVLNTSEGSPYEPNDFEIGADNSIWMGTERNVYGDGGGSVFKSTDGVTFTLKKTIVNARRTEVAASKQNPNTLYVLAQVRTTSGSSAVAPFVSMLKTTDGFTTTTDLSLPNDADGNINASDFTRGQAGYDLLLEVDPNNDTVLYAGGIDLFKSTLSGTTWTQQSHWYGGFNFQYVHADQHAIAFAKGSSTKLVYGNDGGVYYSSDGGDNISGRNKDYNVTQFYHGDIGQSVSNPIFLSGAQDNGTQVIDGASAGVNASKDLYGGDGAYSFIDKDGEYVIVSYIYNNMRRVNLPLVLLNPNVPLYEGVEIAEDSNSGKFINPAELDDELDILYTNASSGGKDSIARYTDIKTANPVRTNLGSPFLNGEVTAFRASPFTSESTKLFLGLSTGRILRVDNANTDNPSWNLLPFNKIGSISCIGFGENENELLVTFHNYGVSSIWFSEDGGLSWVNKEGDFPDIPVKAIMMNPLNNDEVIIGTELGVWRTSNFKDATPNWTQSYNGMSNVKVTSFSLRTADNTVMASTYGRGMFTGQFAAGVASVDDVLNERTTFSMYPTVSSGDFTLFAKNTLGEARLQLFDVRGREVYTKQVDFTQQERQSLSVNLETGVYIVHLTDASNKKATSKVIIK